MLLLTQVQSVEMIAVQVGSRKGRRCLRAYEQVRKPMVRAVLMLYPTKQTLCEASGQRSIPYVKNAWCATHRKN